MLRHIPDVVKARAPMQPLTYLSGLDIGGIRGEDEGRMNFLISVKGI